MTLLSLIVEGGLREPGACFERCRESPSTRMFREGQNSKAAIDVVQQDDDGAVEHFQQHAPGQALRTSGANLTTIRHSRHSPTFVFRRLGKVFST
jgi:hypothetical protein